MSNDNEKEKSGHYDGPGGNTGSGAGGCGAGRPAPISDTYNDSSGPFPIGFKDDEENEFTQKPSWFRQAYNWVKNAHKPDPNKPAGPECPKYLYDAGSDFNGPGFD